MSLLQDPSTLFPLPLGLPLTYPPFGQDTGNSALNNAAAAPIEFARNLHLVLGQEIPRIEELARTLQDSIARAYDPDVDPSRTAALLSELKASLQALYQTVKSTGIGSIPFDLETITTKTVNETYTKSVKRKEGASVVLDLLNQHS